jgi:hypothetical protein
MVMRQSLKKEGALASPFGVLQYSNAYQEQAAAAFAQTRLYLWLYNAV